MLRMDMWWIEKERDKLSSMISESVSSEDNFRERFAANFTRGRGTYAETGSNPEK